MALEQKPQVEDDGDLLLKGPVEPLYQLVYTTFTLSFYVLVF